MWGLLHVKGAWMHLFVAKRHKRLWIIDKDTDQAVYTPPDFVSFRQESLFTTWHSTS